MANRWPTEQIKGSKRGQVGTGKFTKDHEVKVEVKADEKPTEPEVNKDKGGKGK